MLKTVIFGFLLGIVGTVAAAYYVPVVDQHRESSVISVAPNGGNMESFRINIPTDRIMVGAPRQAEPLPPGLNWPADELFDGVRVELFKLRNSADAVVGVASRMVADSDAIEDSVEWVLHLPAREFGAMQGKVSERWVPITNNDDIDAPDGYIELETALVRSFSNDVTETALPEGAL